MEGMVGEPTVFEKADSTWKFIKNNTFWLGVIMLLELA
jgi:hypothetical protein